MLDPLTKYGHFGQFLEKYRNEIYLSDVPFWRWNGIVVMTPRTYLEPLFNNDNLEVAVEKMHRAIMKVSASELEHKERYIERLNQMIDYLNRFPEDDIEEDKKFDRGED